mgnify:CR=1 FL=1
MYVMPLPLPLTPTLSPDSHVVWIRNDSRGREGGAGDAVSGFGLVNRRGAARMGRPCTGSRRSAATIVGRAGSFIHQGIHS